jgi:hypothetical protein
VWLWQLYRLRLLGRHWLQPLSLRSLPPLHLQSRPAR